MYQHKFSGSTQLCKRCGLGFYDYVGYEQGEGEAGCIADSNNVHSFEHAKEKKAAAVSEIE